MMDLSKNSVDFLPNNKLHRIILGYGVLAGVCYLLAERIFSDRSLVFLVIAPVIPLLFLLRKRPFLILLSFLIYYNTVFPIRFLPINLVGDLHLLPTELFLLVGYFFLLKDKNGCLRDLFLGTPVRRRLSAFILGFSFCAFWDLFYLDLRLLGSEGVAYNFRNLANYALFYLIITYIASEIDLRRYFNFMLLLAIIGSILHILIFFKKGEGFLTEIFPVFLFNVRKLNTGTYYGTATTYLRLYNPATALFRCCVTFALSFYLHTRNRKWLLAFLFLLTPVVLQFTRMTWISYLVVFPLFFPIMSRDPSQTEIFQKIRRARLRKYMLQVTTIGIAAYVFGILIGITPVRLLSERFLSVFKGAQEVSISTRLYEAAWILKHVTTSLTTILLGYGIPYMTADSSYLGLLGSMGIVGLGLFIWFSYFYCRQGLRIYYLLKAPHLKALCLASVISFLQVMVNGVSANYVAHFSFIPTLCFLFAVPELSARFEGLSCNDYEIQTKKGLRATSDSSYVE